MTLFLDIHDIGIGAIGSGDDLLKVDNDATVSPGFAWLNGRELVTGVGAAEQAVLHPLHTCTQLWDRLDTEPVDPVAFTDNYAELAAEHLNRIWHRVRRDIDSVVMLTPAHYSDTQLGILAAIAQDLQIPLRAFVPAALGSDIESGAAAVIDVYLHKAVITLVRVEDGLLELGESRVCDGVGWLQLTKRWADAVAAESVRASRFDPLHSAASENALHGQLDGLMQALADNGRGSIKLAGSAQPDLQVTLGTAADWTNVLSAALAADTADLIKRHADFAVSTVILSEPAHLIPGLARILEKQLGVTTGRATRVDSLRQVRDLWPDAFGELPDGVPVFSSRLAEEKADEEPPSVPVSESRGGLPPLEETVGG
jgi:hypothetical protein